MRYTSSLRSYQPSVYHTKMGNPAKCLSQQHKKSTCRLVPHTVPLMLNVKQEGCEYRTTFKVIGLTRLGIKPNSTAPEVDALTFLPSELLNVKINAISLLPHVRSGQIFLACFTQRYLLCILLSFFKDFLVEKRCLFFSEINVQTLEDESGMT